MDYLLHIAILIGIYIMLSVSLNLVVGYTGLLSLAHAAFYGIGAYVAALMALRAGSPFVVNIACAAVVAGLAGALVGIPGLRLKGHHFVIATFSFQVIVFSLLNNWVAVTGGPVGLAGIPSAAILGWELSSPARFLTVVVALSALTLWVSHRIVKSPFGRVLQCIREDEAFTQATGKNVPVFKVIILVTGAAIASAAGGLYAYYVSFIDPTSFTVTESIFIISIVIIGGAGSLRGPVVGAVVLVTLPELLRFVGMPSSIAANVRQILYGGALVAFMMWRPQGLMGEYAFEKEGAGE